MEPEKPEPTDCCGSGCSPCVFEIYEQRLESWRQGKLSNDIRFRRDLLSEICFKPFRLIHREQLTEDVYLYQFKPAIDSSQENNIAGCLSYGIGQHLVVRCKLNSEYNNLNNGGQQTEIQVSDTKTGISEPQRIITRAYTPIGLAEKEQNCCFRIFAKLYRNGMGSEYLRGLQIGDISFWRGPYGEFNYRRNTFKSILMLCVGTGLAPMMSIIDHILNDDDDETLLHLIYGVKSIEHIIMRETLRKMTQFWNFTLHYFFSEMKSENNNMKFGESFCNKKIDKESVSVFFEGKDHNTVKVLVCGTESFITTVKSMLSDLNIHQNNVFVF